MPRSQQIYTLSCEDALAFVCEAAWGFAEVDIDGTFIWVNRAYCEVLNAPAELILGTSFQYWTHPDDVVIDSLLAEKVKSGELPSYTLSKRYIQRGSTPQRQLITWGLLSVSGKWIDSKFVGYRVQFRVYDREPKTPLNAKQFIASASRLVKWGVENWKTILTILVVVMSLTLGGSQKLSESLKRAVEAKHSLDSALESLPPGASPPQSGVE